MLVNDSAGCKLCSAHCSRGVSAGSNGEEESESETSRFEMQMRRFRSNPLENARIARHLGFARSGRRKIGRQGRRVLSRNLRDLRASREKLLGWTIRFERRIIENNSIFSGKMIDRGR